MIHLHSTEIQMVHFRKLVKGMVLHDRESRFTIGVVIEKINDYLNHKKIQDGDLVFKVCNKIKLGQGGYGAVLYGTLTNKKNSQKFSVAIKKTENEEKSISNEREEHALEKLKHRNVVRFFHSTIDGDSRY